MPPAGFEPAIPASERPQSHALDRAAAGIGPCVLQHAILLLVECSPYKTHLCFPLKQYHFEIALDV